MEVAAGNQIYNDTYVTNVLLGVLGFLLVALIWIIVWIWNKREKEYEANRADEKEYKEAVQKSLESLKDFVSEQKTANALAEKDRKFYEKRLDDIDEKIRRIPPHNRKAG